MTALAPAPAPVMRIAWVMVAGAVVSGLDASLANVGLDRIAAALHTDLAAVQWITTGFLIAFAVSVPVSGWLGRRVGAGRMWLGALAAFTVVSGLCAAAPGVGWLIGLRVAQGLAAGLLIPAGQTTIGELAAPGELGRVMATVGIAVAVAPALGPVVGGLLLSAGSWRWLFLVNVPIGLVGLLAGLRMVPRSRPSFRPGPLDSPGLVLASVGLPLIVYGVTAVSAVFLLSGLVALGAFALVSLRRRSPLIDLRLLRRAAFAAPVAAATMSGALIFGAGLLFPLYFQLVEHRGTVETGLRLLAQAGAMALVSRPAGLLIDRFGSGVVAFVGASLSFGAGVVLAGFGTSLSGFPVLLVLVVLGAGSGLAGIAPTVAAYRSVAPAQLPDATTTVNVLQRVSGAVAGAVFAAVVSRRISAGPAVAFRDAFVALLVCCMLALVAAGGLWRVSARSS